MYQNEDEILKLEACNQSNEVIERYLNPADINIASGYSIEVFAQGLDSPISLLFTEGGDMIIAETGVTTGNPRVLKLVNNRFEVLADNFNVPITGINYLNGIIYVSHRGFVSTIKSDGTRQNIITGLPSNGDYFNYRVVFGPDKKMYFGQGTATNSGVVGLDNQWVYTNPLVCDYPGDSIMLRGQNFETNNMSILNPPGEKVYTGAFSPYSIPNLPNEVKKGAVRASGSILRSNLDGTDLELFAWGFRNPNYIRFDNINRLFAANNGYEARGSRPIVNAIDEFDFVQQGLWYGWPDYTGGVPVTLSTFRPEGGAQPEFLLKYHPELPPKPHATFPVNSNIMGFDFNYNTSFGPYGDVYIAEFGSRVSVSTANSPSYSGFGHRISKIDMNTGTVSTFAINKSGFPASITSGGGFERPSDVVFGPDGAMYITDSGWNLQNDPNAFIPNTGVIWRIAKT